MNEKKSPSESSGNQDREYLRPCVLLLTDDYQFTRENAEALKERILFSDIVDKQGIVIQPVQKTAALREQVKKGNFTALLGCGFSGGKIEAELKQLGESCGISETYRRRLQLCSKKEPEFPYQTLVSRINREVSRYAAMKLYDTQRIPLNQRVVICGGGIAGVEAAGTLSSLGYPVTLVEKEKALGGELMNASAADLASWKVESHHMEKVEIFTGCSITSITGSLGNFEITLSSGGEEKRISCGALVLTPGQGSVDWSDFEEFRDRFVPLNSLRAAAKKLPLKQETRNVGILLDYKRCETKGSSDMAFSLALELQAREDLQVHIFLREVRVAAPGMEEFYDQVREQGVVFVKYDSIDVSVSPETGGGEITVFDPILQKDVVFQCDIVGVSTYGLESSVDGSLSEMTGVFSDREGHFQENNLYMEGVETNRPGIFVAGAARGTYYIPEVLKEAKTLGLAVHQLLRKKELEVELSHPVIDKDKCAICLTCVRSCPFKAMEIDREEGIARCNAAVCQRCGICVGECPAKAITLPAYSDEIVMKYVE